MSPTRHAGRGGGRPLFGANLSRPTGSFGQRQIGHFYFAQNRTFLLCVDIWIHRG